MKKNRDKKLCIEGQRIYLRRLSVLDVNEKYLKWMRDSKVNRFLESRFEKWNLKKLRDYVRNILQNTNCIFFVIIDRETGKHIGNIKIGPIVFPHRYAEVGIIIGDKAFLGKGLGYESLKLVKDYAFKNLKIHKLVAGAYINNIGSVKIFKKNGFIVEGIRKKQYLFKGKYVDAVLFGCLKK